MGEIDIRTNEYMRDNEHFADVFNYFLYDGQQVIDSEDLHELDRSAAALPFGQESTKASALEKSRDVVKSAVAKSDGRISYLLLGVENQTNVHNAMPVRNMLYDAISYSNQVNALAAKNRKSGSISLEGVDYLSGMKKGDCLQPVITLVIFWSPDEWNGPRSLYDMLDSTDPNILNFISDYRLNILAPGEMTEQDLGKFKSPLADTFQYIKGSNNKDELARILRENPHFRNLDRQTAELINAVTKSNLTFKEGEETVDMCTAIQQMRDESLSIGLKEGMEKGEEKGMKKGMSTVNFVYKKLYDSGRTDDMQRAMTDPEYLDQLISEFCGDR